MRVSHRGLRALATAALAAGILCAALPATPTRAAGGASAVIAAAESKLGRPWVFGATGPYAFDCAGLVYYAFRSTGNLAAIGGTYRNAAGLYAYFRSRGLASSGGGRPGDLVIYGSGAHVGIYLGNGRVISTLVTGVQITGVYAIYPSFTAFLHTGLSGYPARQLPATTTSVRVASRPARPAGPAPEAVARTLGAAIRSSAVLADANLNVRTRPTTAAPVLGILKPGTALTAWRVASGSGGRWYLIRARNGMTGWVSGRYTRSATPPPVSIWRAGWLAEFGNAAARRRSLPI